TFLIFVSTPSGRTVNAEIQESLSSDFTTGLKTYNVTDGTSQTILIAEKSKDTRVYYRARTTVPCSAQPSAFSDTISVLATAPLPPTLPSYSFAQPPCLTSPCLITQLIHIDGFNTLSKTGALATDQFTVSSDKPWITVSPSGGSLPAGGADFTMTIDATNFDIGSTQATLTITSTQSAGKTGAMGSTSKNVPINISLVAPITPQPKDGNAPLNALLIPAVAHADGAGTRFVSDIRLTNTSFQSITYDITFTPSNIDGTSSGKQMSLTALGGQTIALNDIVKDWYGSGVEGEVG